jgi:hypothetical protein
MLNSRRDMSRELRKEEVAVLIRKKGVGPSGNQDVYVYVRSDSPPRQQIKDSGSMKVGNSVVNSRNRLGKGDSVTKIMAWVLLIAIGLALSTSPAALANTSSAQGVMQTNPAKARKAYLKQQKRQQRNTKNEQKKAQKKWKKQHHTNN